MSNTEQKNVLGEPLEVCGENPITGYFRDGSCSTDETDTGSHTVCASVTKEFLDFSKSMGNDLSTPRPELGFNGLKEGDSWCLCANRWLEAYQNGASTRDLGFQWNTSDDVMRRQLRVWGVSDSKRLKQKRTRNNHIDQLPMQDIIADYNANMPMTRLCLKYQVSDKFLKKCLKQMGVTERTPLPTGAKPKQVESTILSLLKDDYNAGASMSFLSRKYNLSRVSIKRSLEQEGVQLRPSKRGQPKNSKGV